MTSTLQTIDRALKLISLETGRDDLAISTVCALIFISQNEGCSVQDLETRLKISKSGASRQANVLGPGLANKTGERSGLDLIVITDDPVDRRFKQLRLSPAGKSLIKKLREIDNAKPNA